MLKRAIQQIIESSLFKGKIIIIYGARQVGKTTLAKSIMAHKENAAYFNCDEPDVADALTGKTSTEMKAFLGNRRLVVLDEAQRVRNIGLSLKLLVDNYPDMQIIATGSSSFDLSNKVTEPLTGRKYEFLLYPFSVAELRAIYSDIERDRLIERLMVFGMYPGIVLSKGDADVELKELARSYSYKDVLQYMNIRNPDILQKLLQALALQIGSEVSYHELAGLLGIDKNTVSSYIQILEKAFIIFRLNSFSRNLRNELKKSKKIFFYDLGVRNALINNLNPLDLRQDTGALWENFIISERLKRNGNYGADSSCYFWRTLQKQEIDYLEESAGILSGYEIKWRKGRLRIPKAFSDAYPGAKIELISRENYAQFLGA